jgi:hypothetical protein
METNIDGIITDIWTRVAIFSATQDIVTLKQTNFIVHDALQREGFWEQLMTRDFTVYQIQTFSSYASLSFRELYMNLYDSYLFP